MAGLVGSLAMLLGCNRLGVTVDPPALAAALAAVLDDPDLAARLRSAALAPAERYSWARSAAEHQAVYASLAP